MREGWLCLGAPPPRTLAEATVPVASQRLASSAAPSALGGCRAASSGGGRATPGGLGARGARKLASSSSPDLDPGLDLRVECAPEALLVDEAHTDAQLRRRLLRVLEACGVQQQHLRQVHRLVLRVLDFGSPQENREAARLFVAAARGAREALATFLPRESLAAAHLLAVAAISAACERGGGRGPAPEAVKREARSVGTEIVHQMGVLKMERDYSMREVRAQAAKAQAELERLRLEATRPAAAAPALQGLLQKNERLKEQVMRAQQQIKDILIDKEREFNILSSVQAMQRAQLGAEKAAARAADLRLPCAFVRVSVPSLRVKLKGKLIAPPHPGEAYFLALREALASSAGVPFAQDAEDVTITCIHHVFNYIDVRILGATMSAVAASELLARALEDDAGIRTAAKEYFDLARATVAPSWPVARLEAEVEARLGYALPPGVAAQLAAPLLAIAATGQEAWDKCREEDAEGLQEVLQLRSRLPAEPLVARQGARSVQELLEDAARAQQSLKAKLAPESAWAQKTFSAALASASEEPARFWSSASPEGGVLPGCRLFDLGVQSMQSVLAAVVALRRHDDPEPFRDVADVSRLLGTVNTAKELLGAIARIDELFEVVWLANGVANPSCVGRREISIGVRQYVPTGGWQDAPRRSHISELCLTLTTLDTVGRKALQQFGESVAQELGQTREVQREDLSGSVRRIALSVFDLTYGRALRQADLSANLSMQAP